MGVRCDGMHGDVSSMPWWLTPRPTRCSAATWWRPVCGQSGG